MGRSKHSNWHGFTEVRDNNNVIKGARCDRCNYILKKRDSVALSTHSKICKGPAPASKTSNKENSSSVPVVNPTLDMPVDCEEPDNLPDSLHSTDSSSSANTSPVKKSEIVQSAPKKNDRRNINILKFFLFYGIETSEISSKVCRELFESFDPAYVLPSAEEFETTVLKKAVEDSCTNTYKLKDCYVMALLTKESEGLVHAISLIMNTNSNEYVYIDLRTVSSMDHDLKEELQSFCNVCVRKVMDQYKIEIKVIIYDCCIKLQVIDNVDNRKYFLCPCFSTLFRLLKDVNEPFVVSNEEDLQNSLDYFKKIEELKCIFVESKCSLGEGLEILIQYIDENVFESHLASKRIALKFISPVALGCNYLTPKYKGRRFVQYQDFNKLLINFFTQVLPDNCFPAFGSYKSQKEIFEHLFENVTEYDTQKFWNIAKIDFKEFAEIALQLASIPAVIKKIDIVKRVELKKKYQDKSNNYFQLLISLMVNHKD